MDRVHIKSKGKGPSLM